MFAVEVRASLSRVSAYCIALVALTLVVAEAVTASRVSVVAQSAPESDWIEVGKPFPAFALAIPEFEGGPRYSIWRHTNGGGRKDILAFGDSAGATAAIEIYRAGSEPDLTGEPEEFTASIPELRLSGRPILSNAIDTKFGPVVVESFTDRAPRGARQCLRFARSFEEPRLDISGWFCNAGQELVNRQMIACALDRLTLLGAASEPQVGALFARAEINRNFCGQKSIFLAATPKRIDWIEAEKDPKLRGRASVR